MSGMEIHRVSKGLVRISEIEWRQIIYTRRGQRVYMREKHYLLIRIDVARIEYDSLIV